MCAQICGYLIGKFWSTCFAFVLFWSILQLHCHCDQRECHNDSCMCLIRLMCLLHKCALHPCPDMSRNQCFDSQTVPGTSFQWVWWDLKCPEACFQTYHWRPPFAVAILAPLLQHTAHSTSQWCGQCCWRFSFRSWVGYFLGSFLSPT